MKKSNINYRSFFRNGKRYSDSFKEGHIVYGGARRIEKMQDILTVGGAILTLDVTNKESIKKAVDEVVRKENRIDVLWNNAGYSLNGAVENISYEEAIQQFDVNVFGVA